MPAIKRDPPEFGTYRFVCKLNKRLAPINSQRFTSYAEVTHSRALELDGNTEHLIFLQSVHSKNAATRRGWTDVTRAWFEQIERENKPKPKAPEPKPEPTPPPVVIDAAVLEKAAKDKEVVEENPWGLRGEPLTVYSAMIGQGYMKRAEICDKGGIIRADFPPIIKALMEAKLVKRRGKASKTMYKVI